MGGCLLKEVHTRHHPLEDEIKRLKREFNKLVSEKDAEVPALLTGKKFMWNKYKLLENILSTK